MGMKFLMPAAASAWATVGHEEIGRYTESALLVFGYRANAHARAKVHGDLVLTAAYGHEEVEKYKALEVLHYQPMEPSWQCGVLDKGQTDPLVAKVQNPCQDPEGKNHNCILGAAYYFLDHFIHESLLEFPEDPRTQIKSLPLLEETWPMPEQTTQNKLKWLLTLVADMHEPFRWGAQEFDFGKKLKVQVPSKGRISMSELFEKVYPNEIFKRRIEHPDPDILTKKLRVLQLDEEVFMKQHRAIANSIAYWFWRWADQTGQLLCEIMSELHTISGSKLSDDPDKVITIPQDVYDKWSEKVETQMLLAGFRSAMLLENMHEHRKHKEHAKEGRGRHHPRKHWRENLVINAIIAAIQLPLMICCLKFLQSDSNPFNDSKTRSI